MTATTSASVLRFSSSSTDGAAPAKQRRRSKNGPVTIVQGPKPEAKARPYLSAATAEALFRSGGRFPNADRLR